MFLVYLNIVLVVLVVLLMGFLFFMKRYMMKNGFVVRDRKGNPIETTGEVVSEEEPKESTEAETKDEAPETKEKDQAQDV